MAITQNKSTNVKIGRFLTDYRSSKSLSQAQIAEKLGVSRVTVARWENGESKPSTLALKQLERLLEHDGEFFTLPQPKGVRKIRSKKHSYPSNLGDIDPSPYVINGQKDQNDFHRVLIEAQQHTTLKDIDRDTYSKRLSLVASVDGKPTNQYLLESPGGQAKSWNSNYGPHGWHRYVGRFPPHLVRALLNHFQAGPNDLVCDPFTGSGTTLVEARLLGIPSVGIEICSLSSLISSVKSTFPADNKSLEKILVELEKFYISEKENFLAKNSSKFDHAAVLQRKGNNVRPFVNIEKWFTADALLGVSLITQFAEGYKGYSRDFLLTALSGKMRSIGNVDVNVIRAEYSKTPRKNVDVLKLVRSQLLKMTRDIEDTVSSHADTLGEKSQVKLIQASLLEADIKPGSISYIITSPPYGVESLSYLRTHLLSYRVLKHFLKTDPYEFGNKVIGSEYLSKETPNALDLPVAKVSKTYRTYFKNLNAQENSKTHQIRIGMMMNFFQDMEEVAKRFNLWLKPGGKVAFVVGNKKIDGSIIPTDTIIEEIFSSQGLKLSKSWKHKLKTNNSNSRVPWQDRIIEQEFVMIFQKNV